MPTSKFETFLQEGVWRAEWPSLLTTENGDPASLSKWPTKSVQITGEAGTGGSITIQGSNDGVNWATLQNAFGEDLTSLTTGVYSIDQNTQYIRPSVASGDGATDFAVVIVAT